MSIDSPIGDCFTDQSKQSGFCQDHSLTSNIVNVLPSVSMMIPREEILNPLMNTGLIKNKYKSDDDKRVKINGEYEDACENIGHLSSGQMSIYADLSNTS